MAASYQVGNIFGIDSERIIRSLTAFKGIPFRMELIKVWNGVKIINDTAATSPESAIKAILTFPNCILICGGMNKKTILIVLTIAVLLMPVLVLAALNTPVPPVTGDALTLTNIETYIRRVAQFLIIVSVIIAVIFIIWGGVMYMAARGNEEQATKAKTTIFNGIIGAAVVLGVGVILQTLAGLITRSFFA
jgi:hypothetical protein